MHFSYTLIASSVIVASQVSATSLSGLLIARQAGGATIPEQCTSACQDMTTILAGCSAATATSTTCVCTQASVNSLVTCFNCLIGLADTAGVGDTVVGQGNTVIGTLVSQCAAFGQNVTAVTLTDNSTASSTSAASTAAATGTSSTTSEGFTLNLGLGALVGASLFISALLA